MPKCSFLVIVLALFAAAAPGQMTIFNIPSTDVLPAKGAYVEADVIVKPTKLANDGFQTYGWRVVYGVGARTELGANMYFTRDADGWTRELQFSAKTNVYYSERTNFAISLGAIAATPIHDERGDRQYAFLYSNASKVFGVTGGTRVTGGVYTVVGGGDFGTRTGAMVGVEQPIKGKLSFLGDWASGHNRFGYASAGFNWQFTPKQYVMSGYSFGNSGRGNNYLTVLYGYTF